MRTEEIPGGEAVVREANELRGRDRNLIRAAAIASVPVLAKLPDEVTAGKAEGESDDDYAARLTAATASLDFTLEEGMRMMELREATVIATLVSWTLPLPLPTLETIGDLDADLYDALIEKVAGVPTAIANAVSFEPDVDKESPTGDSSSSNGLSRADQESMSTLTSSSDGDPSAGEVVSPEL